VTYPYVAPLRLPPSTWRYSDSQPRDPDGKFGSGHGGGSVATLDKAGYRPGAWREAPPVDREEAIKKIAVNYEEVIRHYNVRMTEDEVLAAARACAVDSIAENGGPADRRTFVNGPHTVSVDKNANLTEMQTSRLLSQVDRWQAVAPVAESRVVVQHASKFGYGVYGETLISKGDIRLSARLFESDKPLSDMMPAGQQVSRADYALAHEWGHTQSPPIMKSKMSQLYHTVKTSPYGRTDKEEAFAEAFAEYQLTGGKTKNAAAQDYANAFGWKAGPP
jgi:hypothetical protein